MVGAVEFEIWSTTACLLITDDAHLAQARELLDRELASVGDACSRFQADSQLSMVNAAAGRRVPVSALFCEILAEALRVAHATDGAVDPTVGGALIMAGYDRDITQIDRHGPSGPLCWQRIPGWRQVHLDQRAGTIHMPAAVRLDLGATAKAFAADRAARRVAEATGCGVMVNLGGDLAVQGPPPEGGWTVRVVEDHRAGPDEPGQTITISAGGLATSSTTVRRWQRGAHLMHHIIDPSTGAPVDGRWRTASVAAATCVDANAAATAALIWGTSAPDRLIRTGLPARLVATDGRVLTLSDWPHDNRPSLDTPANRAGTA